jgi:hypothetical protein
MHAAWRSFFSTLSLRSPVVVVIEDIHWADAALLDLLEHLADRVAGPVLFVCPSRPELTDRRPGWGGGHRNVSSVSIEPLSADHAERLVRLLLSVEDLPDRVRRQILARAEGNPFFLEEIVRHLIDDGRIVRSEGRWRAAERIGDVEIPDTVQGVLAARIDLLDPSHKRALQRAAVVGRVFWPGPVGRLLNGDREQLGDTLDRLVERELVRNQPTSAIAGEPEFIFKHILTRDVAYETLPRRERSRAHASVAEWIESTAGDRRGEFAELLAHHYEQAFLGAGEGGRDAESTESLRARAVEALLEAAEVTRRRFATDTAFRLIDRAHPIAVTPLERARTLEQRGRVARDGYRGDLSWSAYREAADIRVRDLPDDGAAIARACAGAVENPMRWPGSMAEAPSEEEVRRYLELGLERAPEGSANRIRLLTAAAFEPFAYSSRRGTSPEEVRACHRRGMEAAEAALAMGRPDLASAALDGASSALITAGDYGAVRPIVEQRLELARDFDDPWEQSDANDMAAWTLVMLGDYEGARTYGERALEFLRLGSEGLAIHGLGWLAIAELHLGRWDRVVDELGPTVERLLGPRGEDPPYFTQAMMGSLALIETVRRDPRADRHVGLLRRMNRQREDELGRGGIKTWLAAVMLVLGELAEAGAFLDEADAGPFGGHQPLLRQVRAEHLVAVQAWDRVPAFVEDTRAYASAAGIGVLAMHADRLEGRAALAAGDPVRAVDLLERASAGFGSLAARWERARTDASLAGALADAGRDDDARVRWRHASAMFEELRAGREIDRWRGLAERLR